MSSGALAAERFRMTQPAQQLPFPPSPRQRALPATGMPVGREDRRGSGLISALIHALIVMLLVTDLTTHTGMVEEKPQGAGGPGPAGGGGGGKRGTGGVKERVQYVQAPPPKPVEVLKPTVVPPPVVVPPQPKPVVPPPQIVTPPEPIPQAKVETPQVEIPKVEAIAPTPGSGGGTGRDGSAGSGPGAGGGFGSGIGAGRGSGIGPGTGGGNQVNYPPSPTELFIPPLPMPDKVRGFHLVAEYDIDETGKVVTFTFTPTRDGGYNKRLEEVLKSFKFRPGTKPDGTPIRMKAQIVYDF